MEDLARVVLYIFAGFIALGLISVALGILSRRAGRVAAAAGLIFATVDLVLIWTVIGQVRVSVAIVMSLPALVGLGLCARALRPVKPEDPTTWTSEGGR